MELRVQFGHLRAGEPLQTVKIATEISTGTEVTISGSMKLAMGMVAGHRASVH